MKNADKGFLKGIRPSTFLDCYQEWHALIIGLSEILCPPPTKRIISEENAKDIADEYHYYMLGRALGILAWITIGCVIKALFF
jgi:hypothetical protein